jgi:hypothetical protein
VVGACVRPATQARFADKPIVVATDDERPIAEPKESTYYARFYLLDKLAFDPLVEVFDRPQSKPALDPNALDELPNSTWFTNRIGMRDVGIDEAIQANSDDGPPQPPLTIVHAKYGGGNPGFIATDARGVKYLFKFDTKQNPGQQTANDAIVSRILWTAGYNTSAESIAYFRRDELTIASKLSGKFTAKHLDAMLEEATMRGEQIRATASRLLDGKPKGGWPLYGTRDDDPNDRVPHERRRAIRGLRVFNAWLNHTDMKIDNTLDMYVGAPGEGHIVHYLIDFGEALGGHQSENRTLSIGYEYAFDYKQSLKAMFAFGLWHRRWELQHDTGWKEVGYFGTGTFDPTRWKERYPYAPLHLADRADEYWAAKIVMRFDRPLITALVHQGELVDAGAERYLVETLLARREAIGRAYLDEVTPYDNIELSSGGVCGVDLARHYGIATDGQLEVDGVAHPIDADGRACAALSMAPGYHVAKIRIARKKHTTRTLEVHYIGGDEPRVVGLVR